MNKFTVSLLAITAIVGGFSSCQGNDKTEPDQEKTVTVKGTVTDQDSEAAVSGATVTVGDKTAKTGSDGTYNLTISEITSNTPISASADKYETRNANLTVSAFKDGVATMDFKLQFKGGVVSGKVMNAFGTAGVKGVEVTLGNAKTTTDDNGAYKFEELVVDNYTLTIKSSSQTVTREINKTDFVDGAVSVSTVFFGSDELLPYGVTRNDLYEAPELLVNEYVAGDYDNPGIGDGFTDDKYSDVSNRRHITSSWLTAWWARQTITANKTVEDYNNHVAGDDLSLLRTNILQTTEGLSLRTRFFYSSDKLASYVYGRKTISAGSKILSVHVGSVFANGTYSSESGSKLYVDVVDLSQEEFKLIENEFTVNNTADVESDVIVDLSQYIGKEIIIIIGLKPYLETNNKENYLNVCINHIVFAATELKEDSSRACSDIPGTAISGLDGWNLVKEDVASMGTLAAGSYEGARSASFLTSYVNEVLYPWDYYPYLGTKNIVANFAFKYISASPDTRVKMTLRSSVQENVDLPCSYIYAKVNGSSFTVNGTVTGGIAAGFAVISQDGTVLENTKSVKEGAQAFVCDLSKYTGPVVVCFATYPGNGSVAIDDIVIK